MEKTEEILSIHDIDASLWDTLANQKIYFGHQSVGNNIISGLRQVLQENDHINLEVRSYDKAEENNQPALYHGRVGLNKNPSSKITGFCESLDDGIGNSMDIAMFKFCYVDFNKDTDVQEIFEEYRLNHEKYTARYPNLQILHITVPLRTQPKGVKGIINALKGKNQNKKRGDFNTLLRNEYGTENIFDLAYFESTYKDGSREWGGDAFALIPAYTYDGGHLNELGSKIVAEQFLIFLATR